MLYNNALYREQHFASRFSPQASPPMNTSIAVSSLLLCGLAVRFATRKRHALPLPPAEPIIGHVRLLPNEQVMAEVSHEWSQKYGIFHVWFLLNDQVLDLDL